jgi:Icc-related predicted phosphoesterase
VFDRFLVVVVRVARKVRRGPERRQEQDDALAGGRGPGKQCSPILDHLRLRLFILRILLVSDLHYALKQYDWTTAVARGFDVVVLAGDHIDIAGQLDGSVQITVILKYLKRLSELTNVVVSSGNHDLDLRDDAGEKVASWMNRVRQLGIPTDGDTIEFDDTLITICPWQIERDALKPKKRWVWVYHAPPAGSPTSWNGRKEIGDADLAAWIETHRPDIVFTGHIHEAPFKSAGSWADRIGPTWVFNCGRQIGPTPTHIVVNTDEREAAWFSLAGAELARLDLPLERPFASLTSAPAWLNSPALDRSQA